MSQTSSVSCGCFLTLCGEGCKPRFGLGHCATLAEKEKKQTGWSQKQESLGGLHLGSPRRPDPDSLGYLCTPPHRAFGLTLQRVKSLISSLRRLVRSPDLKDGYGQKKTLDEL